MITIHIIYDAKGEFFGFRSCGHAGYSKRGKDIVCAAVSAMSLNLINSTLELTSQSLIYELSEKDGLLRMKYEEPVLDDAKLLFNAFLLGLQETEKEYGSEYIKIVYVKKLSDHNYKIIDHQEV